MGSGDPSGLQNRRELALLALVSSTLTRFRQPPPISFLQRSFDSRCSLRISARGSDSAKAPQVRLSHASAKLFCRNRQTLSCQCRMFPYLMNLSTDRRSFLAYFSSLGLTSTLLPGVLWGKLAETRVAETQGKSSEVPPALTKDMLRDAATVAGLEFTDEQLDRSEERRVGKER